MRRPGLPGLRRIATPIALAVVSLFAALVIWMVVTEAESPRRQIDFSALIEVTPVNVPEGLAVARITPPAVKLTISAEDDTLDRISDANFAAEVDLVGLREGNTEVIVLVRVVGDVDVDIVRVEEARLVVELEPVVTKQVAVSADTLGQVEDGFLLESAIVEPSFVRISGAVSLVDRVTNAIAEVDVEGLRASGERQAVPSLRDGRGVEIRGPAIEPTSVTVALTISQEDVSLPLSIVPELVGRVAPGFNIVGISIDPAVVTVSGTLEAIAGLTSVTTEPIEVTDLTENFTRTVQLRLPAGLQVEPQSVSVEIEIAATPGEIALTVAPRVTDVAEGLFPTTQTASLVLILRGDLGVLKGLSSASVSVTVSLLDLGPGIHVLSPTVEAPPGVEVVSVDPAQVVMVLTEVPSE